MSARHRPSAYGLASLLRFSASTGNIWRPYSDVSLAPAAAGEGDGGGVGRWPRGRRRRSPHPGCGGTITPRTVYKPRSQGGRRLAVGATAEDSGPGQAGGDGAETPSRKVELGYRRAKKASSTQPAESVSPRCGMSLDAVGVVSPRVSPPAGGRRGTRRVSWQEVLATGTRLRSAQCSLGTRSVHISVYAEILFEYRVRAVGRSLSGGGASQ